MDNQKQQVVDKIKAAKNILVTVSSDPSVDQLAACIGLTLMMNKLGKHAAAIFSGKPPSTIEFLKPEDTLEPDTNSLRDFIIALDKSKADKLRYKVEDEVVKIFITPYKTSIDESDLKFSEGEFNVDVVIGLDVIKQQDIDSAVTANGNILHDATVITMTTNDESDLGSVHWRNPEASGVSEMAASLIDGLEEDPLDEQIATAFLTGIVAQTERFSNNLTSSQTMTISAKLMAAGANQQLVAAKLEEPIEPEPAEDDSIELPKEESVDSSDNSEGADADSETEKSNHAGELEIEHTDDELPEPESVETVETVEANEPDPTPVSEPPAKPEPIPKPNVQDDNDLAITSSAAATAATTATNTGISLPDSDGGYEPKAKDYLAEDKSSSTPLPPPSDVPSRPADEPLREHREKVIQPPSEQPEDQPKQEPGNTTFSALNSPAPQVEPQPTAGGETLQQIENNVNSPHLSRDNTLDQNKIGELYNEDKYGEDDEEALPGVHVDNNGILTHSSDNPSPVADTLRPAPGFESQPSNQPQPQTQPTNPSVNAGPTSPPPVPPPMMPPPQ